MKWVIVLVLALLFPATALADDIDWTGSDMTNDPEIVAALVLAQQVWNGAQPNCPNGTLVQSFNDPDEKIAARGEMPGCRIWLDRDWLASLPGQGRERSTEVCYVLAHEYGHNLGYDHDHAGHEGIMQDVGLTPNACRPPLVKSEALDEAWYALEVRFGRRWYGERTHRRLKCHRQGAGFACTFSFRHRKRTRTTGSFDIYRRAGDGLPTVGKMTVRRGMR